MPTLIRHEGFEVRIYTLDHSPAHVHVFKAGAGLNFLGGIIEPASSAKMTNWPAIAGEARIGLALDFVEQLFDLRFRGDETGQFAALRLSQTDRGSTRKSGE